MSNNHRSSPPAAPSFLFKCLGSCASIVAQSNFSFAPLAQENLGQRNFSFTCCVVLLHSGGRCGLCSCWCHPCASGA